MARCLVGRGAVLLATAAQVGITMGIRGTGSPDGPTRCLDSCSDEFVTRCMRRWCGELAMESAESRSSCRSEIDSGTGPLRNAGCTSSCFSTLAMEAVDCGSAMASPTAARPTRADTIGGVGGMGMGMGMGGTGVVPTRGNIHAPTVTIPSAGAAGPSISSPSSSPGVVDSQAGFNSPTASRPTAAMCSEGCADAFVIHCMRRNCGELAMESVESRSSCRSDVDSGTARLNQFANCTPSCTSTPAMEAVDCGSAMASPTAVDHPGAIGMGGAGMGGPPSCGGVNLVPTETANVPNGRTPTQPPTRESALLVGRMVGYSFAQCSPWG